MNFASRLATMRISAGWSMQFVADQVGVTRQTVWNWETGKKIPGGENLIRLEKLYGVPAKEIMGGVDFE